MFAAYKEIYKNIRDEGKHRGPTGYEGHEGQKGTWGK